MTSYTEAHRRVARARGVARAWLCVDCRGRAEEWSLRAGASGLQYENGLAFSLNLQDYEPRCRSCHRKHDGTSPIVVSGERNPMATISDADVLVLRQRRAAGESTVSLAAAYGVNRSTITRIVKGVTRSCPSPS